MSGAIPQGAVPVSVVALLYSILCFTLCFLLVLLLINYGERWTYVTILSVFTALSTFASIIQQLHYATSWVIIKEAQFNQALKSVHHPGLALGGAAQQVDIVLFFIQFYCYNVMSLNILFWAVQLFTGSWSIRNSWLGNWHERVPTISKVFSILWPALIVGLLNTSAVTDHIEASILTAYLTMFTSLTVGSVLLILILYKYVKTRRLVMGHSRRGRWWVSNSKDASSLGTGDFSQNATMDSGSATETRRSIYDRALLIRFSIGFVILAVFEISIIVFSLVQSSNNASIAAAGAPNFSVSSTISDILFFIPGVTASLVAFVVFGTTKSWRQYRDLVTGGCGLKRKFMEKKVQRSEDASRPQGLEFQRLDSLQRDQSADIRRKEAESRIRMFSYTNEPVSSERSNSPIEPSATESSTLVRSDSGKIQDGQPTPGVIEVTYSVQQEDEVIQYGNVVGSTRQAAANPRRPSSESDEIELVSRDPKRLTQWPSERPGWPL